MSAQTSPERKKVTTLTLRQKKERGEIFSMLEEELFQSYSALKEAVHFQPVKGSEA